MPKFSKFVFSSILFRFSGATDPIQLYSVGCCFSLCFFSQRIFFQFVYMNSFLLHIVFFSCLTVLLAEIPLQCFFHGVFSIFPSIPIFASPSSIFCIHTYCLWELHPQMSCLCQCLLDKNNLTWRSELCDSLLIAAFNWSPFILSIIFLGGISWLFNSDNVFCSFIVYPWFSFRLLVKIPYSVLYIIISIIVQ